MICSMSKNPCFHCGLNCPTSKITSGSHVFCCHGCKMVFQLLKNHDLMAFYQIPERHSYTPTTKQGYAFLSHPEIMAQLLDFDQGKHQIVKFKVPSIHCSSCIFLLEQLEKFHPGIHSWQNFLFSIGYLQWIITLRFCLHGFDLCFGSSNYS